MVSMKPITPQQIVDIIMDRYTQLAARQESTHARTEYEDTSARMNELETVLHRISIGYGLPRDE